MSDSSYQALARFRHALRVFERFSEERGTQRRPHSGPAPAAARHPRPPGPGVPSLSDIAGMLQLRLHSAGELVGRAEDKGLVVRWADPDDHRRAPAALTEKGEARLADLSVLHRQELRRFRRR